MTVLICIRVSEQDACWNSDVCVCVCVCICLCVCVCVCLSSDSVLRCMVLLSWIGLFQRFVTVLPGPAATARARSPPRLCSLCARRPLVVLTAHHCCHPPWARAPAPGPGNTSATTTPTQNRCRHRGQTETPTGHTHTHTRCTLQLRRLFIYKIRFKLNSWFQFIKTFQINVPLLNAIDLTLNPDWMRRS